MTLAVAFTVAGLVLDLAGALVLTFGVFTTPEEAIDLGVTRLAGETRQENLRLPQVAERIRQSKRAKIGACLLAFGFALQIAGALLR